MVLSPEAMRWAMHHRGSAATRRLLIVLAALALAAWVLGGGDLAWWDSPGATGLALAAVAINPILVTADRRDASPPLGALAAQARQSVGSPVPLDPTGSPGVSQPLGRRPAPRAPLQARPGTPSAALPPGLATSALPGPLISFDGA